MDTASSDSTRKAPSRNRERGEQQDEAERETPGDVATLSNPSLERIATSPSS